MNDSKKQGHHTDTEAKKHSDSESEKNLAHAQKDDNVAKEVNSKKSHNATDKKVKDKVTGAELDAPPA